MGQAQANLKLPAFLALERVSDRNIYYIQQIELRINQSVVCMAVSHALASSFRYIRA